jgi:carboxyl-terminal processing protease
MTKKLFFITFLLLLFCAAPNAQTTTAVSQKPAQTDAREIRRQSFEKVWTTVNEKHFDPTFGGVDWRKMREIYEPKALAAKTDAEFHAVLNQMLGELKLSHFNVIPRTASIETVQASGGTIGAELKMIDGRAVVSRVAKDSTAEKANLKTGFIIEKIDGKSAAELLAPIEKILTERNENERIIHLYQARTLERFLGGKPDSVVKIETSDGSGKTLVFDVKRYAATSEMSEAMGNFPPQEVVFESKVLNGGDIGYIRFNMWTIPQMAKIRQAVREFSGAKGIVFDLRGNPGGVGGMAPGVAGLLMNEKTSLGSMTSRTTEQKFIVYPQTNPFSGKVVILTDYGSASTSEVFAAGMQEIGRALVVGETTAGGVLPSLFDTLPTGAIFQYAISDYKSPKNILIEKRGVVPDVEIKQTQKALLEGRDLPLEEAVKQILK